jgi:hypothetical protein
VLTMKRILILMAVACAGLTSSGCGFFEELWRLQACSTGSTACEYGVPNRGEEGVLARASSVRVESSAGGKQYDVSFRGRTTVQPRVLNTYGGDTTMPGIEARGRFSGEIAGRVRGEKMFDDGRWLAEGDLHFDRETQAISGDGILLLRFAHEDAGMLCVRVLTSRGRVGEEVATQRGRFIAIGGTERAAHIVASGSFNDRARDDRGKLGGLTRARLSRYERGLSRPCAEVAYGQ